MPPDTYSKKIPKPSNPSQLLRGIRLGLPIFLGYLPVGAVFGVVSTNSGFTPLQAITCSATALAGAGQFIALSQMNAGASVLAVLTATTIVNLRYVLFGATLSPHLRNFGLGHQAVLAYTLTDETFAININDCRQGNSTAWSMLGVGVIAWCGWVLGTTIGALSHDAIGDPSRFGLEFAMPAMFAALFVALADNRRHLAIGLVSGAIALTLPAMSKLGILIPDALFIIIAAISGAAIGAVMFKDERVH